MKRFTHMVYISGPYSAETPYLKNKNIRRAIEVHEAATAAGFVVYCPHTTSHPLDGMPGMEHQDWLLHDFEVIRRCDAVVLTPMWETSNGATQEVDFARQHNIPIFRSVESAVKYFDAGGKPDEIKEMEQHGAP